MILKDIRKLPIEPAKLQKDKISISDRIQALMTFPQVVADLKAIEKAEREHNSSESFNSESFNLKENFCKRYKLPDYCVSLNIHPPAIKIIRPDHIKSFLKPMPVKSCGSFLGGQGGNLITIPLSHDEICKRLDFFIPSDGKHLPISIDLSKTETEIIAELKRIFKEVKKTVKKSESREKLFKVDKWEVFEMHTKDNEKFTQIARDAAGMEKHVQPAYNKRLESWRQAVKRAYREAKQIREKLKKESNLK